MAKDYQSWKFTQKVTRIFHNRAVVKHFKNSSDGQPSNGADAIKSSLLIRPKDSALVVLNKQLLFMRIGSENLLTSPESWIVKSLGNDIPQLKIIYRVNGKTKSGNYDLCVPHYNGSKAIKPPKYTKGNQPVIFNLKDRTKLVVNASSEAEGKSVINYLLKFVESKFIPANRDNFVLGAKSKVKRENMKPVRGDFYSEGQLNPIPKWRIYF